MTDFHFHCPAAAYTTTPVAGLERLDASFPDDSFDPKFLAIESKCKIGECPLWCSQSNCLFWIDIEGKLLFCLNYCEKTLERWDLEVFCPALGRPCCLALCESFKLLVAFEASFAYFNTVSHVIETLQVANEDEWQHTKLRQQGYKVRLNDGRVDREGSLVIGGINESWGDWKEGWEIIQPCYSVRFSRLLSSGQSELSVAIIENVPLARISNSICFSVDGSEMFYTDTPSQEIKVMSYDSKSKACAKGEGFLVAKSKGQADGSIVDARGGLWNAEYEGGVVNRYNCSEKLYPAPSTICIPFPVKQMTCPCIGGPSGNILFATSASNFFASERYREEPLAGSLFLVKLSTSEYYIPENRFVDI